MNTYLKAEKMKYRHTFLWWLMILMPAVSAFLSAQLTHNYFAMDGYNWWYMLMMPGFLAVACSQIGGKDHKKQNRTIWVLPADEKDLGCKGAVIGYGKRTCYFVSDGFCSCRFCHYGKRTSYDLF